MRDLILKMTMSLDGLVSDLEGRNSWMLGADPQPKAWSVELLSTAGLHAMGGHTFRGMAAWWPTATDAFAPPMSRIPKVVFSRRGEAVLQAVRAKADPAQLQPGAESWGEAHVASGELAEEVALLKAQDGGPVIAHGGVRFARSLLAAGLADQLVPLVMPVALGRGLPLFADLPAPMPLTLISSTAFPGGAVAQVYRPA